MRDVLIQILNHLRNPEAIMTQDFSGSFGYTQGVLKAHMPDDGSKELIGQVFDEVWAKYMAERKQR